MVLGEGKMADRMGQNRVMLMLSVVVASMFCCGCFLLDSYHEDTFNPLNISLKSHEGQPLTVISSDPEDRTIVLNGGKKYGLQEGMVVILSRNSEDYGRARILHVFRNTAKADLAPGIKPEAGDVAMVMGAPSGRTVRRKGNVIRAGGVRPYVLDVGAGDGVRQGMLFTISRGGEYVGVLSVIDAYRDTCTARAVDGLYDIRVGDLAVERGRGEDALMPHKQPTMAPSPEPAPPTLGDQGYNPYPQK